PHSARALRRLLQAKGRGVGLKETARMRAEGGDAQTRAMRARITQYRLVAQMHAIEIAKRDRGAARVVGNVVERHVHAHKVHKSFRQTLRCSALLAKVLRSQRAGGRAFTHA